MFAKLFNDTKYGQILVVLNTCDEGKPQITFSFQPEGLGVCSVAINGKNTSEQCFDKLDNLFNEIDENKAVEVVEGIHDEFINQ